MTNFPCQIEQNFSFKLASLGFLKGIPLLYKKAFVYLLLRALPAEMSSPCFLRNMALMT